MSKFFSFKLLSQTIHQNIAICKFKRSFIYETIDIFHKFLSNIIMYLIRFHNQSIVISIHHLSIRIFLLLFINFLPKIYMSTRVSYVILLKHIRELISLARVFSTSFLISDPINFHTIKIHLYNILFRYIQTPGTVQKCIISKE